jgi:hypothetical protein
MFLIIFMIILGTICSLYICKKEPYKLIPNKINLNPLKSAILLTMYIGENNDRKNMYVKNIMDWLNKTNIDIYTVNSSGEFLNINHPRLNQVAFIQNNNSGNSSELERDSIIKANNYFNFSKYDLVFKITGKYFLPDFENMIKYIPSDAELVVQNQIVGSVDKLYQNSELVGFKPSLIEPLMKKIVGKLFEQMLGDNMSNYKTYKMRKLTIERKEKRGDGSVLNYL